MFKHFLLINLLIVLVTPVQGQEKEFNYEVNLNSGFSSDTTLPFWLASNRYGSVPDSDFVLLNASVFSDFNRPDKFFDFSYRLKATGYYAKESDALINELFLSLKLSKYFFIDFGSKNDDVLWKNLSSSNGNLIKSINARAMPGINIKTNEFLAIPFNFTKKWLSIKGNFSHYFMNDKRHVDDTYLHHKSLFIKLKFSPSFEVFGGIDHYVQWSGESEKYGEQPSKLTDYARIVLGLEGDSSAESGEQINALGNHLGAYLLQFNFKGEKTNFNFYYSHPFNDRSGREFANIQDGLYGVFVDFKKDKALFTSILGEFTYTKHMSGSTHLEWNPNDGISYGSGLDNYLNHRIYSSGWTYYGKTIGSPYFTPTTLDENGISNGVIKGDNRFMAFNLAANGNIWLMQYKAMLSHTTYFGWFEEEYDLYPVQFSGLFEAVLPQSASNLPFDILASASFDTGTYRPVNFGAFLSIRKIGVF